MERMLYALNIQGVKNHIEMDSIIMEINNCEFCNNGTFSINLKEFHFNKKVNTGVTIAEIIFNKGVDIQEKIIEMLNCEFCHSSIGDIVAKAI